MPIYEYQCESCEVIVSTVCSYKDKPAAVNHVCSEDDHTAKVGVCTPIMSAPAQVIIAVDAGGRKGYVTNMGGGKKTVKSETRKRMEHLSGSMGAKEFKAMGRGATKSIYTKSYERDCKQKGIKERKG
jgi:hypothetical protein